MTPGRGAQPDPARRYSVLTALLSIGLALLTLAAIAFAPPVENIRVVAQSPDGVDVALDSPIIVTFSRPVDRRSAERAFLLYPITPGRFEWRAEQTLLFYPARPLLPGTVYRVTIRGGLRDTRGWINRAPTSWPFRTIESDGASPPGAGGVHCGVLSGCRRASKPMRGLKTSTSTKRTVHARTIDALADTSA
jgi:hypothetical protein